MKKFILFVFLFNFSISIFSQTIIHSADFESGVDGWTQDSGDSLDWTRDAGGTPSSSTGPSDAYSGSFYMYTEASGGNDNKTANFESPSFDLTGVFNPEFSFYYNMYGRNMGSLYVDISTDGGVTYPTNLWQKSDDLGVAWYQETINLSAYIGQIVKIRFRGVTGDSYRSDMAIDNITLSVSNIGPEINVLGNGVSITSGDITPSPIDNTNFGVANVGAPTSTTFTIQNLGSSSLNLLGTPIVSISGAPEFTIETQPSTSTIVSGGSDVTFVVKFTPVILGNVTAVITINNDDSNESSYTFKIQGSVEQNFFDSDGDGVFDNVDVDDDNDGVLDAVEELACRSSLVSGVTNYKFLNETFGTGERTTINTTYDATTTYCYEDGIDGSICSSDVGYSMNDGEYTVGSSAQIASWAASQWWLGGDHTGNTDGRMALFNADYVPGVFYTATINGALPNIPITYSFWVLNLIRTDGTSGQLKPDIRVEFRGLDGNVLTNINTGLPAIITTGDIPESNTGDSASWYQFTADLILDTDEFHVYFINNQVGGMGNDLALDDIIISQTLCDTDSDGVGDIFDLDSDNDGIPDVVECGLGNLSGGTAKISSTIGWVDANGNGMHDSAESNTVIDSDGDGVPNYLDLDSDNDGIFDVDESGAGNSGNTIFKNEDGDIDGDGVGDGLDTDNFRETDVNSDGIIEYFTDGILDVYDYFNGASFTGSYGNINQGLTGAGWKDYLKDTDSDGIPDYIDTTSDGVSFDISNTLYAGLDANNDGVIDNPIESDGDGLLDAFDTDNLVFGSPRNLTKKFQLYFDGRNDYVAEPAVIDGWAEASMMGWIKMDPASSGNQVIFGQNEFYVQLNSNKSITTYANGKTLSSGTSLNIDQWVHLAAIYSSANSSFKLFINGIEVSSTSVSGALPVGLSSLTIGRRSDTDSDYYHGYIDEVRVFDKAISINELHKMIYQEIQNNGGVVRGSVIPRNITNYVDSSTITPLDWTSLKRYYRLDTYKGDVIDDLTTAAIDSLTGAKMYNIKIIKTQTAPLPFVTQQSGSLPVAVSSASKGWNGNDVITYDWSIVKVNHSNVTYNNKQQHLGLFVNQFDASANPIEFSIQNDSELNVSWYLKLDGFIDLEGESQLVQGDDSILDENSGGFIERDQQGTASSFNYNYWTSSVGPITPVGSSNGVASTNANFTISNVLFDGTDDLNPKAINFQPSHSSADSGINNPIIVSSYWLYKFNGTSDDYYSWASINENSSILPGEGFTMKGTSGTEAITTNQNYVFKGKPNNGEIKLPIIYGNDRLVGNPYASAIDANKFILDNISDSGGNASSNVFNGALYFWDHFAGKTHNLGEYVGGYSTRNLIGGVKAISNDIRVNANGAGGSKIPGQFIPVNQGFFVYSILDASLTGITAITGGDITFKNSQREFKVETPGNSVFMKSRKKKHNNSNNNNGEETKGQQNIWLQFDSPKGYHRQILVGVNENTTNNFDLGYDAPIADINAEDMFWIVQEAKIVIQGVNNFDKKQELPLGIVIKEAGITSIKVDSLENLYENKSIYIKDKETGKTHKISETPYEINLEAGEYLNRFSLTFRKDCDDDDDDDRNHWDNSQNWNQWGNWNQSNHNNDSHKNSNGTVLNNSIAPNEIVAFMNNTISELVIRKNSETDILSVHLFNNLGQLTASWNNNFANNEIKLPVKTASGVYVVQINKANGSKFSKKIVVK